MTPPRCGPRNHILDIAGLTIGHADDGSVKSGSPVPRFDEPAVDPAGADGDG